MPRELPLIDEFDTLVDASASQVFLAVGRTLGRSVEGRGARVLAGLLGCVNRGTSYTVPPVEGQEANGFRVVRVTSPKLLVLEGRHRFATYRLTFSVDPLAETRSQLRARTDAIFPGALGALYRALVIGSGGHEIVVRRVLAAIVRNAERLENGG